MPSQQVVQKALETIRKSEANYQYFFEKLDSPDWLQPLHDAGLFQQPPAAVRVSDRVMYPSWPETGYLARVAGRLPDSVLDILLRLPATDNVRVHGELVCVALALPPGHAARWVATEIAWIENQPSLDLLGERLGQLIVHLATGGEGEASIGVAGRLFETAPDVTPGPIVRDVRIKLRDWEFDNLLHRISPVLLSTLRLRAFEFLQESLATAVQMADPEAPAGQSWIWRPAIEEHEQNPGHRRPLDSLLVAIRDGGSHLIDVESIPVTDVVTGLLRRGGIFARIGLYLLAKHGQSAQALVARCVGDRALFDAFEVRHEYESLSEAWFGRIDEDTRQLVLTWIGAGPGEDQVARWRERLASDAVPAEIQRWQRDRLYPLRGSLPVAWFCRYDELVAAVGPLVRSPGFAV